MQQYIDFFHSQRQKIEDSCAPLLNATRAKAFESFVQSGFPVYQSENYKHTDISDLLKEDLGFYLERPEQTISIPKTFHCHLPNFSSFAYFIVNGYFYKEAKEQALPSGVFSGSLNEFANQHPGLFSSYYHRQAGEKGDGLTAFNTMFVQDGYVLYVPKNVIIEKPIQLTNLFTGNKNSLVNRRFLFILEPGAQAKILVCDHTVHEEPVAAATQVCEIYAGENAVFDFYELEESSKNTVRLSANYIRQSASSNVMVSNVTLVNGTTRNNYTLDLAGEHAETHLQGLAIVDSQQKIDNFTVIHHQVPNCRSNELFKYLLEDEATGCFSGKIIVAPDAQKTEAYQNNRNLLGSNDCRMYSKPQLEIYADDVKCSHGMTTGQMDETALFYMRSRGIPEEEARHLLKLAFTMDVLNSVRLESLQDRLKMLTEKRFRGELVKCQECI
jgi:Fe-S cluster assembly protein SufD